MKSWKKQCQYNVASKIFFVINCLILCSQYSRVYAAGDPINELKNGIIEVYSGFTDDSGKFYKMKNASAILVASEDNKSYVVTNYSAIKINKESKRSFCKKNKISYTDNELSDAIRAVIKGDVTVETSVLTESRAKDYCILEINNGLGEKTPLCIGNSDDVKTGDIVYTLGFAEDAGANDKENNRHTEFDALDVEIYEGTIQDFQANRDGILCIQHSAKITKGNTGGPLVDQEGYVIGLNNVSLNRKKEWIFYSLPVNEIKTVLNNYKINYDSRDKLSLSNKLERQILVCQKLVEDKRYKEKSKEELKTALANATALQSENVANPSMMAAAVEELEKAKSVLVFKMKTTRKIIYVFFVVMILMAGWMVKLLVRNNSFQKKIKNESDTGTDDPEDQTVMISAKDDKPQKNIPEAQIRCIRTGERRKIDHSELYIGKSREVSDFSVYDNPVISRRHAVIRYVESVYYIRDCGSVNGTYVNGLRLNKNQEVALKNGDKIVLANEKFVFQIYDVQTN